MENRFLEMDQRMKNARSGKRTSRPASISFSQSAGWSKSLSAQTRALVILIENGGVDLGIPDLVDRMLRSLGTAGSLVPDSVKQQIVSSLREAIVGFTDNLLETAELTLNRYRSAQPNTFSSVVVLRNGTATYNELKNTLQRLTREGKIMDILILTHGGNDSISVAGGVTGQKIRDIKTELGRPLSIRSVYMMNCVGSSLNQAWLDAGAKVSSGAIRNNYLPEPTTYFFWNNWKEGQSFENAVTGAYRRTINLVNNAVKGILGRIPGLSSVADSFSFENYDFVRDSAPVIQGNRSVTINSDDLTFSQSQSVSNLATTVLQVGVLQSLHKAMTLTEKTISPQCLEMVRRFTGNTVPNLPQVMNEIQAYLNSSSNITVDLNQNQFDAMASFIQSIGTDRFNTCTLRTELNRGNFPAIPAEIRRWNIGMNDRGEKTTLPDLAARRNAEANLFESATATASAQSISRYMSGVNYSVPGPFDIIRQPSRVTCWAAVMTMMMGWRRRQSMDIRTAMSLLGPNYVRMFDAGNIALDVNTARQLYADAGLTTITSFNPTIEGWERLLRTYGPLYVDIGYSTNTMTHAIIVMGISGDGTAEGTNITYVDPDPGRSITVNFRTFLSNYEAPGAVNNWPYVIVHWPAAISGASSIDGYSRPFYDTGEHAILAEFINTAVSGPIANVPQLQPGTTYTINTVPLTYGQIITMGDFYDTYQDLQRAPAAELNRLKTLIARSENHYKFKIFRTGTDVRDVSNEEWGSSAGIGHRFIELALANNSHFSPPPSGTATHTANNKQSWERYHTQAIQAARAGSNSSVLDTVYPINAFGDHFLTDAFSAGHLMNKEIVMTRFLSAVLSGGSVTSAGDRMLERIAAGALAIPAVNARLGRFEVAEGWIHWDLNDTGVFYPEVFYRILKAVLEDTAHQGNLKIANLAAKAVHDRLNTYPGGVPVRNNRGQSWNLTGDGTLNVANVQIIQQAVKQSVENIEDSVRNPGTSIATYCQRVWDYVPNLADATTSRIVNEAINTYTNPSSDALVTKAITLVQDELPTLLNELIAARKIRCIRNNNARTLAECEAAR